LPYRPNLRAKAGIGGDEEAALGEPETIGPLPREFRNAAAHVVLPVDLAAGHLLVQTRTGDRVRAPSVDPVEVELHHVTVAAEVNRDAARIRRPLRVVGFWTGVEIVVRADIVERHDLAVRRFGHLPDVKILDAALALTMRGQRNSLVRREPAVDDGVFVPRVVVVVGSASRRGCKCKERGQGGEQDEAVLHVDFVDARPAAVQRSRVVSAGTMEKLLHQRELQQQRALEQGKIIVGDQRQHRVAFGRHMRVDALHVVDLLAEIGLEDRRPIDERTG
jgi:hypothetical protein